MSSKCKSNRQYRVERHDLQYMILDIFVIFVGFRLFNRESFVEFSLQSVKHEIINFLPICFIFRIWQCTVIKSSVDNRWSVLNCLIRWYMVVQSQFIDLFLGFYVNFDKS